MHAIIRRCPNGRSGDPGRSREKRDCTACVPRSPRRANEARKVYSGGSTSAPARRIPCSTPRTIRKGRPVCIIPRGLFCTPASYQTYQIPGRTRGNARHRVREESGCDAEAAPARQSARRPIAWQNHGCAPASAAPDTTRPPAKRGRGSAFAVEEEIGEEG